MRINPDAAKIKDNKNIRHLFYIILHFSCKINIFVVSLQKEFMNPLEKVDSNIENKKSNKSSSSY